jgi:glycosyltransferase involved in cell wall biosynthesis
MKSQATMFFLLNSLDIQRGGLTKASLMQANLFAELGYDTYLLTFNFNPRYSSIIQQMTELGKIDKRVKFLNMYELLSKSYKTELTEREIETLTLIQNSDAILDPHIGHNSYRVYENGLYTKYLRYDNDSRISFIDYFNEQRYRTKREDYDEFGCLRKVSFMDYELNKPRQMIFYNDNERAYLSKWVNPKNGLAFRVNYFNNSGELKEIYASDLELKTKWLESIISKYDFPVLVSDARAMDPIMLNVKIEKAIKIWRLHSNHVGAPHDINGEIADTVSTAINAIDELDVALVLTEQQRIDIEERFGKKNNIKVIPHYMENFIDTGWFNSINKNESLAVVVGRFSGIKRIDHTIMAFRKVVDRLPEAKLELWGYGNEEKNLRKLIRKEGLDNNVTIKGFTHNPSSVYEQALFSILASKSEGFSLGILESMASGASVVSYDINYGPRDLINHGETGWIVENGDVNQLAEKMIWMFMNKKDAIKMGKKAAKSVKERFNKTLYSEKWVDVVESAVENKKRVIDSSR